MRAINRNSIVINNFDKTNHGCKGAITVLSSIHRKREKSYIVYLGLKAK